MYEEVYMALVLIGALNYSSPFAVTLSMMMLTIVFLKPYLSVNYKYIVQIGISALMLLYILMGLGLKIYKLVSKNKKSNFLDNMYKTIYGTYESEDVDFVNLFVFEAVALVCYLLVLLFSIQMERGKVKEENKMYLRNEYF